MDKLSKLISSFIAALESFSFYEELKGVGLQWTQEHTELFL